MSLPATRPAEIEATTRRARSHLRKNFLEAIADLFGEPCRILTYEQTYLTGTFSGWKPDGLQCLIRGLQTPANIRMEAAIMRGTDILAIHFDTSLH